jgi:transposase
LPEPLSSYRKSKKKHHTKNQTTQIPNTEKAIRTFLKSLPHDPLFLCESSGNYEALPIRQTHVTGRPIARINAREVREFAQALHPIPLSLPDLAGLVKLRNHILTQITQNNHHQETISDKALLNILICTD